MIIATLTRCGVWTVTSSAGLCCLPILHQPLANPVKRSTNEGTGHTIALGSQVLSRPRPGQPHAHGHGHGHGPCAVPTTPRCLAHLHPPPNGICCWCVSGDMVTQHHPSRDHQVAMPVIAKLFSFAVGHERTSVRVCNGLTASAISGSTC